ncbi:cation transporter [Hydrotalea sandarakina]|jgi:copper chaperone CopZ|uniref:Copper chaperone CopZ n=1 Tax=Hydrotalea sandarakina TaxID=1004304 RepID=A0A2W7S7H5_9BACT|nr:cation transporter [Hydrotalea sandarakina]PZX62909.1 copper chaperone CopZ [Hydrotalea sandarakina]
MRTVNAKIQLGLIALILAFITSLSCIMPVVALITKNHTVTAFFSWMEPYRPALISITFISLVVSWYQFFSIPKLDKNTEINSKFSLSKKFYLLSSITLLSLLLITFPFYSSIFIPKIKNIEKPAYLDKTVVKKVKLMLEGMECEACTNTIKMSLANHKGVVNFETSFSESTAIVEFNMLETTLDDIIHTINSTGYSVSGVSEVK